MKKELKLTTDLQTGDILHCKRNTLLSKLICWLTKSEVSHSALVVEAWGQPYIIEAQRKGVHSMPLEEWLKRYKYKVLVSRPEELPNSLHLFSIKAFNKVGTQGYDFISLIIRHPWALLTGGWIKRKDPDSNKTICSELVAKLYDLPQAYRFTPKKLLQWTRGNEFVEFPLFN